MRIQTVNKLSKKKKKKNFDKFFNFKALFNTQCLQNMHTNKTDLRCENVLGNFLQML